MITDNLRINQLGRETSDWYINNYLAAMDTLDVEAYGEHLADQVSISFNNEDPIQSKNAVKEMLSAYWQSFRSIEHDLLNIYGTDDNFMLEALNHYVTKDGRNVTTRAVALTDRDRDGKVVSVRILADVSQVLGAGGSSK